MPGKKENRLEYLLPHRPPMLLLDRVIDYGEDFAEAELKVLSTSRFFDANLKGVPAWIGVEYMAQTMAIWSGSRRLENGKPVEIAFLLGSRNYCAHVPVFEQGMMLCVRCEVLVVDNELAAFECIISSAKDPEQALATARLNAFSPENPAAFIQGKK